MAILHTSFLEHSSVPDVGSNLESITDLLCDLEQFIKLSVPVPSTEQLIPTSPPYQIPRSFKEDGG